MIQIFDNKYTKDMALEELIKWIQKHFDRVDRVICVNDNLSFKNNYDFVILISFLNNDDGKINQRTINVPDNLSDYGIDYIEVGDNHNLKFYLAPISIYGGQ